MLNHGWSLDLLKAWQTVSARNHLSQIELRTYVEGETIIARHARVLKRMRDCYSRGTRNPGAMIKMERDVDRWTMFLGVGTLCSGVTIHRDRVHT